MRGWSAGADLATSQKSQRLWWWAVSSCVQLAQTRRLRNAICITRLAGWLARLINAFCFAEASPPPTRLGPVRDAPRHLGFQMDPGGKSDASAILSQKQNIIFNFLRFRALYAARLRHGGGQERCQNDLTHRRADFDPICQPSQRYSTSLFVKCADHREGARVREMHRCNWTWNVISLPATKVQADWGPVITDSHLLFGDTWTRIINTARDDAKSIWLTARICAPLAPPTVFHYGDIWSRARFLTNPRAQGRIWSVPCFLCSIMRCSLGKEPSQTQTHTTVMDNITGPIGTIGVIRHGSNNLCIISSFVSPPQKK